MLERLQKTIPCEMRLIQADFTDIQDTMCLADEVVSSGRSITYVLHCPSAQFENIRFKNLSWEI